MDMATSKGVKDPPIKLLASVGTMKTMSGGTVNLTLSFTQDQLLKVMSLLTIKQDGDMVSLTAKRLRVKIKKKENAPKEQDHQKKTARRVRRYPYRD